MISSALSRYSSNAIFLNLQSTPKLTPCLFDSLLSSENPSNQTNLSVNFKNESSAFACNSKIASFVNVYPTDICMTSSANQLSSFILQNQNYFITSNSSKQLVASSFEKFGNENNEFDIVDKIEKSTLKVEVDGDVSSFEQDSRKDLVFEKDAKEAELTFNSICGYKFRSSQGIETLYFGRQTKIEILSLDDDVSISLKVFIQKAEKQPTFEIHSVGNYFTQKVISAIKDSKNEEYQKWKLLKNGYQEKQEMTWFGTFVSNFENIDGHTTSKQVSLGDENSKNSLCVINATDLCSDIIQSPLRIGMTKFNQQKFIRQFFETVSKIVKK
jgi:hypothetical protein